MELLEPKSVVDVGCGHGIWLSVFKQLGVADVLGIDGEHVDRERLSIPLEQFVAADLTGPLTLGREFDLVMSLEVAEHLPQECAAQFVDSLVRLGPVVLFSAAIPNQGGHRHVNEQWPEYWRHLFAGRGYASLDGLRQRLWASDEVDWWYLQNMILYVDNRRVPQILRSSLGEALEIVPALVHPRHYLAVQADLAQAQAELWAARTELLVRDVVKHVRETECFALVDDTKLWLDDMEARTLRFPEREGCYLGPPPNDDIAVAELERLRTQGVRYLFIAWPSFWWLDRYTRWGAYLRNRCRCIEDSAWVVGFELETTVRAKTPAR
jgi:SAM-dependent methyltransferase